MKYFTVIAFIFLISLVYGQRQTYDPCHDPKDMRSTLNVKYIYLHNNNTCHPVYYYEVKFSRTHFDTISECENICKI